MNSSWNLYAGYRYPGEVIAHAGWLYHRFCLSFRDVQDLLAERGITVNHETTRQCCLKFGSSYARYLPRRQGRPGDMWFLDEVFITINDERCYLWRAVDQDGDMLDILAQKCRNASADSTARTADATLQVDATSTGFLIEPWSDQQSIPTLSAWAESGTLSHPERQGV